jgi:hypothetical protein
MKKYTNAWRAKVHAEAMAALDRARERDETWRKARAEAKAKAKAGAESKAQTNSEDPRHDF